MHYKTFTKRICEKILFQLMVFLVQTKQRLMFKNTIKWNRLRKIAILSKTMAILTTMFLMVSCDNSPNFSKVSEISSGEYKAQVFVSSSKIQVHELISQQIKVTFPFNAKLNSFDFTEENEEIILNDSHLSLPGVISENRQFQQINCSFYANSFGEQMVPAIKINFNNGKNLLTAPVMFEVLAPKQAPTTIHGIEEKFTKGSAVLWITALTFVLTALAFAIIFRKKSTKNSQKTDQYSAILASNQPDHEKLVIIYNFLKKEGKHPDFVQKAEAKIFAKANDVSHKELLKEAGELS